MPIRQRCPSVQPCSTAPCPTVTSSPTIVGCDGSRITCTMVPSWMFVRAPIRMCVHVAADDRVHPDAAFLADDDVADDLGAVVDEGRGRDGRARRPERSNHGACRADLQVAQTFDGPPQIFGSVTPRCAWYLPFLSLYDVSQTSSLWKNRTCAMPSLA